MNNNRRKRWTCCALAAVMALSGVPAFAAPAAREEMSLEAHAQLSRRAAGEGMVLLENHDQALPLSQGASVALFGKNQIDYVKGGGGSGDVNVPYTVNLLQGLQEKEEQGKVHLYQPLVELYQKSVTPGQKEEPVITSEMMANAAANADTAIVAIGRYSQEGSDRKMEKGDYLLSDQEEALLKQVCAAGFQHVVVVLNVGGVIDTQWITENPAVEGVLLAWQGGMEGGGAMADILCGDVNPSGKLTDTFAKDYWDYPTSQSFHESQSYVNYEEDIFVGYRYFETFDPNYENVNYEFGYGLSYTTFDISDVTVAPQGENMVVEATVTNSGQRAGKEVVQVYFSAPQGVLGKPAKELAAFAKTQELAPGESQTLTLTYPISDMSSYDDTGKVCKSAYVMEAGDYHVYVGNSVKNAGESGVAGTYTQAQTQVTQQLTQQVAPTLLERRLLADGSYEQLETAPEFDPHHVIAPTGETRVENEAFLEASDGACIEHYYANGLTGTCVRLHKDDWHGPGKYLTYQLEVEQAGTYDITFHASNGYNAIENMLNVYVNGNQQPKIDVDMPQTDIGPWEENWYTFMDLDPITVTLPEGTCTLKLESNGRFGILDYMVFEKNDDAGADLSYPVAGDAPTTIEAEAFMFSDPNVGVEKFTEDGQEKQCLAQMHIAGRWTSYYLDVAQEGDYTLNLRASYGNQDTLTDFVDILVDDVAQEGTFTVSPTGSWSTFRDLEPITIHLPAGPTVLKVVSKGTFPNLDTLTLTPVDATSSRTPMASEDMLATAAVQDNGEPLMLADVYADPQLMDRFLDQLTISELIHLAGGQPNTGVADTGGIGNLPKYGVPNAMTADGPAGLRLGVKCTAWPCITMMGCTWNRDLVEEVGAAAATEAKDNGIDIWLTPGMNIHRNPLCGRNFEYYSEDPLLSGKLAAALTRGVQSQGISITLKHFIGNNKETNRTSSDSRMSERALREIYCKGFEIAVKEADPWCVMSSYNYVNGTQTAENEQLLTNILRKEWGFDGLIMSDWTNNSIHPKEVKAGNNVKMPKGNIPAMEDAVLNGYLTREDLEENARYILELVMKTNVFYKVLNPVYEPIGTNTKLQPGSIYTASSSTIRSQACNDEGGGKHLAFCEKGEWVTFNVQVEQSGTYDLSARIASPDGAGKFKLYVDDQLLTSFAVNAPTGGWEQWSTLDAKEVYLEKGQHTFKLSIAQAGLNINWLHFQAKDLQGTPVTGVTLEPAAASLTVGDTLSLTAVVQPENADDKSVTWTSSQPDVVEVDQSGMITAVRAGKAVVTVTTRDGGFTASSTITVEAPMAANKTLLQKTYDYALTLSTDGVTDAAKKAFETALENAEAVLADDKATQEEVNAAWDALLEGIWGLGLTQGDKTMLELLIAKAEDMTANADQYVADHWQDLVNALAKAEEVMDDGNAMEEDVQPAAQTLLDAILAQRFKADKSILEDLLNKAENLNLEGYTAESVAAFRSALAQAQAVLADEALTEDDQNTVDAAVDALNTAMDGLTAEGEGEAQPSDKPETTDKPEASQKPEATQKPENVPQTGDSASLLSWAAALALSGTAALWVVRRKERN